MRREHAVFRRTLFLEGRQVEGSGLPDVWWFRSDGRRMTRRDWTTADTHTLGVFLNGDELAEETDDGELVVDDSFLLLFNPHFEDVEMHLPTQSFGREWALELSTAEPELAPGERTFMARAALTVSARSLVLLRRSVPAARRTPRAAA